MVGPPMMGGGGMGAPPMGGVHPPMMGAMPPAAPLTSPAVSPVQSPLDMWSFRKFGQTADRLTPDDMAELIEYVATAADEDVDFWKARNDRFMESQQYWEIGTRYGQHDTPIINDRIVNEETTQKMTGATEVLELNDGYLVVDKITSMIAGAAWGLDVPPKTPGMEDAAQDIEDWLRWLDRELEAQHISALNSSTLRDEIHYAALRGWITGMVLPSPETPKRPLKYVLEDPMFVYPRYTGDKLIRVVRRYSMTALEAQSSFPAAFEFLLDFDEDEELEVTEYYDEIYRMAMLSEGRTTNPRGGRRTVLQPLTRHGYIGIDGSPINPWIIVAPRGTPSRRVGDIKSKEDRKKAAGFIGLDVLHPIKHIIDALERLASMQMTEVAKGVDPPKVVYYDGSNKPEVLDLGIGAENYMMLNQEKVEILNTTSMKPDAGALLTMLNDRLQKGSIPGVLYGQAGFALAGYAINLLSQGAQDVVRPLLDGIKAYREIKYRRMLEMYVGVAAAFAGPVQFGAQDPVSEQMYTGSKTIDPVMIRANGVYVEVTYDDLMPRDLPGIVAAVVSANQAGMMPLYDAMKRIGMKDPKQAMQRLAEGLNFQDPMVQKHLARIAGSKSGNILLKQAIQAAMYEEQMMQMMQQQMMAQQAGGGQQANATRAGGGQQVNMEQSPPANQNPITAAANQMNAAGAAMNVGNGASPPAGDLTSFLEGQP